MSQAVNTLDFGDLESQGMEAADGTSKVLDTTTSDDLCLKDLGFLGVQKGGKGSLGNIVQSDPQKHFI